MEMSIINRKEIKILDIGLRILQDLLLQDLPDDLLSHDYSLKLLEMVDSIIMIAYSQQGHFVFEPAVDYSGLQ